MVVKNVNTSNAHTKCVGTLCCNFMFYATFQAVEENLVFPFPPKLSGYASQTTKNH